MVEKILYLIFVLIVLLALLAVLTFHQGYGGTLLVASFYVVVVMVVVGMIKLFKAGDEK